MMSQLPDLISVLHVDDDPEFVELAAEFLEREDDRLAVETVTDPREALDRITADDYDCLVVDYDMPRMNGIDVLEQVREEYPDLPLILYTGKGSEELASEAISAGVTDYLQKGSGTSQYAVLANRIENAVSAARTRTSLQEVQEQLEFALTSTNTYTWKWDLDTDEVERTPALREVFDVEEEPGTVHDEFLGRVHPADRPTVESKLNRARRAGEAYRLQYRIRLGEEWRWVQERGRVAASEPTEDPAQLQGIVTDISDQKDRVQELHRERDPFSALYENFSEPIITYEFSKGERVIRAVNDAFVDVFGYDRDRAVDATIDELLVPPDDMESAESINERVQGGESVNADLRRLTADGERVFLFWNIPVPGPGSPDGFAIYADITERKHQEERFQSFIDQSTDIFSVLNPDGTYGYLSPSVEPILGYDPEGMIGENAFEHVHPDDRDAVVEAFERALDEPEASPTVEYRFKHADGSWRWLESRGYNQLENPAIEGYVVNSRDITDRKKRERELERHEAFLEHSRAVITVVDADGVVQYQSAPTEDITGYSPPEVTGQSGFEFVHPDDVEQLTNLFTSIVSGPESEATVEFRAETADEGWRWIEARGVDYLDDPVIDGVITSSHDITERKERELELERIQRRYSALFESTHDAIAWIEFDGETPVIQAANPAFEDTFALNNEDVVGRDLERIVASGDRLEEARDTSQQVKEGQYLSGVVTRDTVDGPRDFLREAVPVEDPETGEFDTGFAVYTDITEQKDRERTLEALVQRTGDLVEPSSKEEIGELVVDIAAEVLDAPLAGLHLLSEDGQRLEAVAAMDEVREEFGVPPSYDRQGETSAEGVTWEAYERGEQRYIQDTEQYGTLAEESPARSAVVQPIKEHGVFIISATETDAFDQTDRNYVELLSQTLTAVLDRVEGESKLRERSKQLERLHETSQRLMTAGTEGEIADHVAAAAEDILALPIVMVRYYDEQEGGLVPVAANEAVDEVFDSRHIFTPEEGSLNWQAYESGAPAIYDDVNEIEHAVDSESPVRSLMILPVGDYGTISAGATAPAAFDEDDVSRAEVLASTAELALERLDFENHLIERQERLERQRDRFEQFASMVSHDLRNPLNVAAGSLELVQEELDSDDLDRVGYSLERMETLIDDLLSLSRAGQAVGELETVSLADTVESCWRTVDTTDSELHVESELVLEADESRLQQLLENLIQNAVKHGGDSVTVTVGELPNGFYVEDDGRGIPETARENLFEVGFSTTEAGTGLGLNIVRDIAEAHSWEVAVNASDEGGARFEFTGVEMD